MSVLTLEAKLERQDPSTPWGFRMQGGKDFSSPLSIARVTPGSLAAKCGLQQGDAILKIGSKQSETLKHKDAQDAIIAYGNKLDLLLQRIREKKKMQNGFRGGAPTYDRFATPNIGSYQSPAGGTGAGQANQNYNTAPKPFGGSKPTPYTPATDNLTHQTQNLNINQTPNYSKYADIDDKPGQASHQSRSFKFLADTLDSGQGPPQGQSSAPQPWQRAGGEVEEIKYDAQGKRLYRPSETFKLIQEQENEPEKQEKQVEPKQTRTIKVLEKQLGDQPSAPAHAPAPVPVKAPAAPKPGVWTPGQPSGGGGSAPAAKPFTPSVAPPVPTSSRNPPKPSGVGAVRGKIGDAVMKTDMLAVGRVPICASCGKDIRGPFVLAMGKTWCPDHFICANPRCGTKLLDIGFVEEGGFLYCEKDYELYFAPHCAKCDAAIVGECVNALNKQYHPACFLCHQCKQPIGGNQFHLEDGNAYCENDWRQMFQTMCTSCNFPIEPGDKWVEALNSNFHSECFNCSTCQVNLEGQAFYAKTGKPYCKKHAR